MEQQLAQVLADTQSSVQETRRNAEATLQSLYADESFPLSLAAIASEKGFPTPIRQAALLVLRRFVLAAWSPNLDEFKGQVLVNNVNKARVRSALLDLATSDSVDERRVKASASYVVSKIASADFPEDWPELLPSLLQIIPRSTDVQLRGALTVLHDLIESCSEDQFFKVAREVIETVFDVATKTDRKPILRALAVSVFKGCFDPLELILEEHRDDVKHFLDQALNAWAPFFLATMKEPLPPAPSEDEEMNQSAAFEQYRGAVALKLQVIKTFMKVRAVFPSLLTPMSPTLFGTVWTELSTIQSSYLDMYIVDERQSRLEDANNLPYTLDFLVLEDLDFMQSLVKAPPVRSELEGQLKAAGATVATSSWLPEVMKVVIGYAQITTEEEGLWDIDVNLFLSEETSVTANYTPRSCAADLVIKFGEWLKEIVVTSLLHYVRAIFTNGPSTWKLKEAALYILNQLLRDMAACEKIIPAELASGFDEFIRFCISQEQPFLRSRGYLVAASLAKAAAPEYHQPSLAFLEQTVNAVTTDSSEIVQVACIRALQDFLEALPAELTKPCQVRVISTIADYLSTHDLTDMPDSDELKFVLVDTLRGAIVIDPSQTLSTPALDVLFGIANTGATNFQLGIVVTETFEEVVQNIAEQGPDAYAKLCEKVLPSLTGALGSTNLTHSNPLTPLAADLLRALTENGPEPFPQGFVASTLPKLAHLLLTAGQETILPPATLAVKFMLENDPAQFLSWQDPQTGKSALETALIIVDHLLSSSVGDAAAAEVGSLAAELVEKAGSEQLGPFFPQLLSAVARRLATAEQPQIIQSLTLVFARLSIISPREVIDFLAPLDIDGKSALHTVLSKWLDNSISFAGYEEIRQNVIALTKIYQLEDPRIAQIQVKGDLIVQDTGRIKTRSQARKNPDRYTIIPAPVKIIKVLVEELSSAAGGNFSEQNALVSAGAADLESGDEVDDWEDVASTGGHDEVMDLNLGLTKQQLMGFLADSGSIRTADDEAVGYLKGFFAEASQRPGFQDVFAALSSEEQEKLKMYGP
ncbi:hypothetical protein KEM54_004816 [Ascosphaera aggregata]|nr:hypothetical protein KEM54_004816 [Ascosphaera aggregata]